LSEYFAGSELDESTYNSDNNEEDELILGSLRNTSSEPSTPSTTKVSTPTTMVVPRRRAVPSEAVRGFLPDRQALNPAVYVNAINDMLQPYLQALRLTQVPPDTKFPDGATTDEKKTYDLPPPAYSELFPVPAVTKEKFSLATRLSLRGRSFLRWTGMAGDAGLSPSEIEVLRRDDRRKAWTRDYMLLFFWVHFLEEYRVDF
jgi:hypothetical protein